MYSAFYHWFMSSILLKKTITFYDNTVTIACFKAEMLLNYIHSQNVKKSQMKLWLPGTSAKKTWISPCFWQNEHYKHRLHRKFLFQLYDSFNFCYLEWKSYKNLGNSSTEQWDISVQNIDSLVKILMTHDCST